MTNYGLGDYLQELQVRAAAFAEQREASVNLVVRELQREVEFMAAERDTLRSFLAAILETQPAGRLGIAEADYEAQATTRVVFEFADDPALQAVWAHLETAEVPSNREIPWLKGRDE